MVNVIYDAFDKPMYTANFDILLADMDKGHWQLVWYNTIDFPEGEKAVQLETFNSFAEAENAYWIEEKLLIDPSNGGWIDLGPNWTDPNQSANKVALYSVDILIHSYICYQGGKP